MACLYVWQLFILPFMVVLHIYISFQYQDCMKCSKYGHIMKLYSDIVVFQINSFSCLEKFKYLFAFLTDEEH